MTTMNGTSSTNNNHPYHDTTKKQGGYGKIPIHQESKWKQLLHFDEVIAAMRLLYISPLQSNVSSTYIQNNFSTDDYQFCNTVLTKVSRSFAVVIQQLPSKLLVDVTIFYLVLRALDTIEDDMNAFDDNNMKVQYLQSFHEKLGNIEFSLDNIGDGDEKMLLQQFYRVNMIYNQLSEASQFIIKDITKRMGYGMASYVNCDFGQGTKNIVEYNKYCYYVAGLVGEGLSRLFLSSSYEIDASLLVENNDNNNRDDLNTTTIEEQIKTSTAIRMGLFLQKTNIIRDFLEDYVDQRTFWPQEVWKKYSFDTNKTLGYYVFNENSTNSDSNIEKLQYHQLLCLNELINDALLLIPSCIRYMNTLRCYEIFRFCAIPQIMAIATLNECYNNNKVYSGVIKIRKGLSCSLILHTTSHSQLYMTFHTFIQKIKNKAIDGCNRYKNMNMNHKENSFIYDTTVFEHTIQLCGEISDLITQSRSDTSDHDSNNRNANQSKIIQRVLLQKPYPSLLLLGTALFWDYLVPSTTTNSNRFSTIQNRDDNNSSLLIRIGFIASAWYMYSWTNNNGCKLRKAEDILQQQQRHGN